MTRQPSPHWINGRRVPSIDGRTAIGTAPSTGEELGSFADAGEADAEAAIAAARRAFERSDWAHAPRLRAQVLLDCADRVERRAGELAALLTAETGKLIGASRAEIGGCVSELRYYAGLARVIFGRVLEVEPGVTSILSREPAGVAGIIVPWNAPGILLVRSLAPAMAAGCTSVVKGAGQAGLFHTAFMDCLAEVEAMPAGVVNSLTETGSAVAKALVASPEVDVLSYTGSSAVGKAIMAAASQTLKRLNLELGGKAPCVVFPDVDVEWAAPRLVAAGMVLSGQQCTAANRILVHESILGPMREALSRSIRAQKVGPGEDPATQVGPLIDRPNRDRIANLVKESTRWGEVVVEGGVPDDTPAKGAFIRPSLLEVGDLASPIVQEEFFGPVLNLESFGDEAEAVHRANATRYGLAASVWTHDDARAQRVSRAIRSGTVWINDHNKLFPEAETGGYRESGFGRLHGAQGMDEFLQTKHVWRSAGRVAAYGG